MKPTFLARWGDLMVYVSMIILAIVFFIYTNHAIAESQRKLCAVVSTLDDTYAQTPPTTPTGRQLAAEMHVLRLSYRCASTH
jgi:hypothetical protein